MAAIRLPYCPLPQPPEEGFRLRRRRPLTLGRAARALRHGPARGLQGGLVAAILGVLAVIAIGVPQDWAARAALSDAGILPMPFEKPGESFPGSAYYYLAADAAAAGVAQPSAGAAQWDDAPMPAPGPALTIANGLDRSRALACLTAAIYYEAATEPDDGQRAIAQVILNRVAHPAFPKTVCGVVYQGSERTTGCQFTFSCDGSLARRPDPLFWARAEAVARQALAGQVFAPVGLATHYHTFAVHPLWDQAMDFVMQIGAHRFYRLLGAAGSAPAFRLAYAGHEPLPAPHPRLAAAALPPAQDPLAIERAFAAGLGAAQPGSAPQPAVLAPARDPAENAYRLARDPRGAAAVGGDDVRTEYRASGSWISQPQ